LQSVFSFYNFLHFPFSTMISGSPLSREIAIPFTALRLEFFFFSPHVVRRIPDENVEATNPLSLLWFFWLLAPPSPFPRIFQIRPPFLFVFRGGWLIKFLPPKRTFQSRSPFSLPLRTILLIAFSVLILFLLPL